MRRRWSAGVALAVVLGGTSLLAAQTLPAGAHSADEVREDPSAALMREAEAALEKQDYKTAEAKLSLLAAKRPQDAQVLYDLGFAQESNGEEAAAATSYGAAVAADGGLAEPRVALGLLEARRGQADAARRDLKAVAGMTTASPEIRGRALRALARLDETSAPGDAREELLAAVKLTGETAQDTALAAELAGHAGDAPDAESAYRRAVAADPDDLNALAGLAHVLVRQGKDAEAEALLRPAIEKHPDDARLVAQMASALAADGKESEAAALVESARSRSPQMAADAGMTRLLAQVYAVSDTPEKAEPLYRGLIAAGQGDPALADALGGVLVKERKYAEAERVLGDAVAHRAEFHNDTDWAEAAGHLGFAASKNGNQRVTLQALAARATVLPDTPATLFLEATAYDALHQYQQAVKAYRAFLAVANGKFPDEEFEARHRLVALKPAQ